MLIGACVPMMRPNWDFRSGPGNWAFGDSLELGVPGGGVLTWEESKSHLGLYAITSQPLFLSNDVRPGYMQQRLIDMVKNPLMLSVNGEWDRDELRRPSCCYRTQQYAL